MNQPLSLHKFKLNAFSSIPLFSLSLNDATNANVFKDILYMSSRTEDHEILIVHKARIVSRNHFSIIIHACFTDDALIFLAKCFLSNAQDADECPVYIHLNILENDQYEIEKIRVDDRVITDRLNIWDFITDVRSREEDVNFVQLVYSQLLARADISQLSVVVMRDLISMEGEIVNPINHVAYLMDSNSAAVCTVSVKHEKIRLAIRRDDASSLTLIGSILFMCGSEVITASTRSFVLGHRELQVELEGTNSCDSFPLMAKLLNVITTMNDVSHFLNLRDRPVSLHSIAYDYKSTEITYAAISAGDLVITVPGSNAQAICRNSVLKTYNNCLNLSCDIEGAFMEKRTERIEFFFDMDFSHCLHLRVFYNGPGTPFCFDESLVFQLCNVVENDFRSTTPQTFERNEKIELNYFKVNIPRVLESNIERRKIDYQISKSSDCDRVPISVPGLGVTIYVTKLQTRSTQIEWDMQGMFIRPSDIEFTIGRHEEKPFHFEFNRFQDLLEELDLIYHFSARIKQTPFAAFVTVNWFELKFTFVGSLYLPEERITVGIQLQFDPKLSFKRRVLDARFQYCYQCIEFAGEVHDFRLKLKKNMSLSDVTIETIE